MSARLLMISLALVVGVNSANAQRLHKPDVLECTTYPVADLVIPIRNGEVKDDGTTEAKKLMKRITSTIARDQWDEAGGAGTIQYSAPDGAFFVSQRESVHKEIAHLLASLRKFQEVQVSVELRYVTVSPQMTRRLVKTLDAARNPGEPDPLHRYVLLDDKQTLALLAAVQGDRQAHIMQAPKITLFNGQKTPVGTMMERPNDRQPHGCRCEVQPIADPERQLVRLSLDLQLATPEIRLVKAGGTFNVASDHTLVWHLGEVENPFGSKKRPHLFVLATPRIRIDFTGRLVAEEQVAPPKVQALPLGVEMRFVSTSGATAKRWLKDVTSQTVALDEQQMAALLDLTASDRGSSIVDVPRLRVSAGTPVRFEYQHKEAATTEFRLPDSEPVISRKEKVVSAWRCEIQRGEFASADGKDVLLSLSLTQHRGANADDPLVSATETCHKLTINTPADRTLVWHLGEQPTSGQHLFVVLTPRAE